MLSTAKAESLCEASNQLVKLFDRSRTLRGSVATADGTPHNETEPAVTFACNPFP